MSNLCTKIYNMLYHTTVLGSTQPLEISTRIFLGVKTAGAEGWRPHHLHVPSV